MERKVNRYFITIPVSGWQIAQILGSETNWDILETLRDAGIEGLTAEQISEKTQTPKSTVYNVLSKLQAADWVDSGKKRKGWGRPKKENQQRVGGKPSKFYIQTVDWGNTQFDEDFIDSLDPLLEQYKDKLKRPWLEVLGEIVTKYKTDDELKDFFPKDPIHEKCGTSHEAIEFLLATSLALLGKILEDDDFDEFARKCNFVK